MKKLVLSVLLVVLTGTGAHLAQAGSAIGSIEWVDDDDCGGESCGAVLRGLFGFADRGYLREGAFADIFVFDLDTVGPGPVRRVRDFPANTERLTADAPTGVRHVLVNGTPIRRDGVSFSGSDLRPGRMAKPSLR